MTKPLFSGACTALVTPFRDGRVNHAMLETLIARQLEADIPALVLCGTTGEAPTLSDDEKLAIFRTARQLLPPGTLICGTGSNDTHHAVKLSQAAEKAGADALLIVTPYYNKATPQGLIAHYRAISEAVDIPIIAYNVPSRTGVDLGVAVCARLAELPNLAGIKEAHTDITRITRLRSACGPDFSIWTGNDDMTVAAMALGAAGVISVSANVVPQQVHAMTRAALRGDFASASAMQRKLQPLNDALFAEVNPVPVKAALAILGHDCGAPRLPLTEATDTTKARLRQWMNEFP